MSSLGILGGSFNPPHLGHIALARDARCELALDRVLLMPLHTPPHKPADAEPGPLHRLEMCRLAAAGVPGVEVSALEIERGGPSYTADTLKELHEREPEAELTFIVGADTALTLPSWRDPREVLSLARLAVAGRPATNRREVLATLSGLLPAEPGPGVVFLSMAPLEASSTEARERIAAGRDVTDLLPAAVADYVTRHALYAAAEG